MHLEWCKIIGAWDCLCAHLQYKMLYYSWYFIIIHLSYSFQYDLRDRTTEFGTVVSINVPRLCIVWWRLEVIVYKCKPSLMYYFSRYCRRINPSRKLRLKYFLLSRSLVDGRSWAIFDVWYLELITISNQRNIRLRNLGNDTIWLKHKQVTSVIRKSSSRNSFSRWAPSETFSWRSSCPLS